MRRVDQRGSKWVAAQDIGYWAQETNWRNWNMCPENQFKLNSLKAEIGTLCGPWIKNPIVMRRRLFVTTVTLGDHAPRHKKMSSLIFWLGRGVTGREKTLGRLDGGTKERYQTWATPQNFRIYTHSTSIDIRSNAKVQHDNHKVVIVKYCDAIPGLPRPLGPQHGDYFGRWSRRYTRSLPSCCASRAGIKKQSHQSTPSEERRHSQKFCKGVLSLLNRWKESSRSLYIYLLLQF